MATSPTFSADSNAALSLRPCRTATDALVLHPDSALDQALTAPFHPKFTYPVFGDDEKIWGYKGLNVEVRSGCACESVRVANGAATSG
jgi:histone acetyltransferase 1